MGIALTCGDGLGECAVKALIRVGRIGWWLGFGGFVRRPGLPLCRSLSRLRVGVGSCGMSAQHVTRPSLVY